MKYTKLNQNLLWNISSGLFGKVLSPLLQLITARFLAPEHFGAFATSLAFFLILDALKDLGFQQAIIAKGGRFDSSDQSTLLLTQITISTAFILLILASGESVAASIGLEIIEVNLYLLAPTLLANIIIDYKCTEYIKSHNFKPIAIRQATQPVFTGIATITLIMNNLNEIALALGYSLSSIVMSFIFLLGPQSPQLKLNTKKSFDWELLKIGKEVTIQRICGVCVLQLDSIIASYYLLQSSIGNYRMSFQLSNLAPNGIYPQMNQVMFANAADNKECQESLQNLYTKNQLICAITIIPYSLLGYFLAPYLIPLVLGHQWQGAIMLTQIYLLTIASGVSCSINNELAKSLGFTKKYTKYALFRALATTLTALTFAPMGVETLVIAWCSCGFLCHIVNELIFFSSQKSILPNKYKAIIYAYTAITLTLILWQNT